MIHSNVPTKATKTEAEGSKRACEQYEDFRVGSFALEFTSHIPHVCISAGLLFLQQPQTLLLCTLSHHAVI